MTNSSSEALISNSNPTVNLWYQLPSSAQGTLYPQLLLPPSTASLAFKSLHIPQSPSWGQFLLVSHGLNVSNLFIKLGTWQPKRLQYCCHLHYSDPSTNAIVVDGSGLQKSPNPSMHPFLHWLSKPLVQRIQIISDCANHIFKSLWQGYGISA